MFYIIKKIWNDVCCNTHSDNNNNSKLHIRLSPASPSFSTEILSLSLPQKDKETKNLRRTFNKLLITSNGINSKKKSVKFR